MQTWNLIPPSEFLDNEYDLINACTYLRNSAVDNDLATDTETTGLRIDRDYPLMGSFSDGIRRFAFLTEQFLYHPYVVGLLTDPTITKVGTNIKFDKHMYANAGIELRGPLQDTVVMDWLYDENRWSHGLKETARDYCGIKMREFKEVFPMRKATRKVPAETAGDAIKRVLADPVLRVTALEYSGLDPYATMRVRNHLRDLLKSIEMYPGRSLWDHYLEWEVPFTSVLWNMERRGFSICTGHLRTQIGPIEAAMQTISAEITQMAGWAVNINSPQQLRRLFFQQLGRKPIKMTDGGKSGIKEPSTDEEVLSKWAEEQCPFSQKIMEYRKISKIFGTYIEGMLEWVDPNLRIHTTLKQVGTVTGRLSSADPNLQNIPRPKGDRFHIRDAFVAPFNKRLVDNDYDQLEMKIMAHFSGDDRMVDAIRTGKDLHCFTVSLMFGVDYDLVVAAKKAKNPTPEQEDLLMKRQSAKAIGFGLIYGIGPKKLASQLTEELGKIVTKQEARQMIQAYFNVFPGVKRFIDSTKHSCHMTEFVQTLVGRFRRLPQINARSGQAQDEDSTGTVAEAERQSVNSIIQGTAADITKAAMMRCENDETLQALGAKLLLQIHDELIFEVDDNQEVVDKVKKRVKEIMEKPFGEGYSLQVPLTVGGEDGYTWADAK